MQAEFDNLRVNHPWNDRIPNKEKTAIWLHEKWRRLKLILEASKRHNGEDGIAERRGSDAASLGHVGSPSTYWASK